jgi:hypothetical protein
MNKILVMALAMLILSGAGCDLQRLKINPPGVTSTAQTAIDLPAIPEGQLTVFISQGCPHCAIVESHVKNKGLDKKLPIAFMEINGDKENLALLLKLTQQCGLSSDELSIPMLWDGSHCLIGDKPIMKFIDDAANQDK